MKKSRILAAATALVMGVTSLNMSVIAESLVPEDNIPVLSGTYKNSSYYYDSPLGVAGNFHLFAFDSINIGAHCNGNFAAPNVTAHNANGTNQNTSSNMLYEYEVSLATEKLDIANTTLATDLLIPMNSLVTNANGEYKITNPISGQIKINGNMVDMNSKVRNPSVFHIGTDYIDFGAYKKAYADLSTDLRGVQGTIEIPTDGNSSLTVALGDGTNVLNLTSAQVQQYKNGINFTGVKLGSTSQSLVINVDLKGVGSTFSHPGKINIDGKGSKEENVNTGINILWNFYDSSADNDQYTGTIVSDGAILGSILAPYATVNAQQNIDGTIIANNINTSGETHRADFKGPLPAKVDDSGTTTVATTAPSATVTTSSTTSENPEPAKETYAVHYVYMGVDGKYHEINVDLQYEVGSTFNVYGSHNIVNNGNAGSVYNGDITWDVYIDANLTDDNAFTYANDLNDSQILDVENYASNGLTKLDATATGYSSYTLEKASNIYFVVDNVTNAEDYEYTYRYVYQNGENGSYLEATYEHKNVTVSPTTNSEITVFDGSIINNSNYPQNVVWDVYTDGNTAGSVLDDNSIKNVDSYGSYNLTKVGTVSSGAKLDFANYNSNLYFVARYPEEETETKYTIHYVYKGLDGKYHDITNNQFFVNGIRPTYSETDSVYPKAYHIITSDFEGGANSVYSTDPITWTLYVDANTSNDTKFTSTSDLSASDVISVDNYEALGLMKLGEVPSNTSTPINFADVDSNLYFVIDYVGNVSEQYKAHYVYYSDTYNKFVEVDNDTLKYHNQAYANSDMFAFGTDYPVAGLNIIQMDDINNWSNIYSKYGSTLEWDVYIKEGLNDTNSFNATNDITDAATRADVPDYSAQGLKYQVTIKPGDPYKFDDYSNVYFVANLTQKVGVDVTFVGGKETSDPSSMDVTFGDFGGVNVNTNNLTNWEGNVAGTWHSNNGRTQVAELSIPLVDKATGNPVVASAIDIDYDVPTGYVEASDVTVESVDGRDVYHIFLEKYVDYSKLYNAHYVYYNEDVNAFVELNKNDGTRYDTNQYSAGEVLKAADANAVGNVSPQGDVYHNNWNNIVWDVYVMNDDVTTAESFNASSDWTDSGIITNVAGYTTSGNDNGVVLKKIDTIKPGETYTFADNSNVYLVANVNQKVGVYVIFADGKNSNGPDSIDVTLGTIGSVTVDTTNNLNTSWNGSVGGQWINGATSTSASYIEEVPYFGENGQINDIDSLEVNYTVPAGYQEAADVAFDSTNKVYHIYLKQLEEAKLEYTAHYVFMGNDGKYHEIATLNGSAGNLFENDGTRKTFLETDTLYILSSDAICNDTPNAEYHDGWNGTYSNKNISWDVYVSNNAETLTATNDLTAEQIVDVANYSTYGLKNVGKLAQGSTYADFDEYKSNVYFVVTMYRTTYHLLDNTQKSESGYAGARETYDTYTPSLNTTERFKVVWRDGDTGELYEQGTEYEYDRNRDLYPELIKTGNHTPWAYFNILNYNNKHYIPGDKVLGRVNLDSTANEFILVKADGTWTSDLSSLAGSTENYFMVSTLVGVDTDNVTSTRFTISTKGFSGPNFYDVTTNHTGNANIVTEFKPFGTNSSASTVLDVTEALPEDYYNSEECDAEKRYDGMRQVRLILPASAFENEVLYINYYYYDSNSNQYLHGRYALNLTSNDFWTLRV